MTGGRARSTSMCATLGSHLEADSCCYRIIVDRYALPDGADTNACDPAMQTWCGGTWNTIRNNLDYIQGAGFTASALLPPFLSVPPSLMLYFFSSLAVWISPVSRNYEGERTPYGDAYHGYWISDASQLNGKFGTSDDLMALSNEVHRRGMYLMVDVVVNDVMSLSNTSLDYDSFLFKDPVRCALFSLAHLRANGADLGFLISAYLVAIPHLLPC